MSDGLLRSDRLELRGGVLFSKALSQSAYRDRWDDDAADDPVRTAIATNGSGLEDIATLTGKIAPLWTRFPANTRVGTLIDIGAGYGRIELFLSAERGLRCDTFCAIDISEAMLRRLQLYRERHDVFPGAAVHAICTSASDLPLEDASVDLVISSAVFLHMGKSYVAQTLAELARVLKPGGNFIFDSSFPNRSNPSSYVPRLKPERFRKPHALKYWSRAEIERLIDASGLAARVGAVSVDASHYAALPKRVGPLGVPLARKINARVGEPRRFRDVLTVMYSAYSRGALAPTPAY
jgi:SAM-dependent methyltransferase